MLTNVQRRDFNRIRIWPLGAKQSEMLIADRAGNDYDRPARLVMECLCLGCGNQTKEIFEVIVSERGVITRPKVCRNFVLKVRSRLQLYRVFLH